jgi:hypothetical protein
MSCDNNVVFSKDEECLEFIDECKNKGVDPFFTACSSSAETLKYLIEHNLSNFDSFFVSAANGHKSTYLMVAAEFNPRALAYLLTLDNAIDYVNRQNNVNQTLMTSAIYRVDDDDSVIYFLDSNLPTNIKLDNLKLLDYTNGTSLDFALLCSNRNTKVKLIIDFISNNESVNNWHLYCPKSIKLYNDDPFIKDLQDNQDFMDFLSFMKAYN